MGYVSPLDIEREESRDDFVINIDESTNHLDISSMQTFSPFCQRVAPSKFRPNGEQHFPLDPDPPFHCRMDGVGQRLLLESPV